MNRREEQDLIVLRRELAMLQKKHQELASAALLVEQQRNQVEQMRVTALSWLIALLLEHHEGEASLTIPLVEELTRAEYRLNTIPGPNNTLLHVSVVDGAGNRVKQQSALEGAGANGDALKMIAPVIPEPEPEQPKAIRCPECGFAYGMHREGCALATNA